MSLLNKLKYAFGLDTSNDLEDDVDFNALPDASVHTHKPATSEPATEASPASEPEASTASPVVTETATDDVPLDAIFEHVVQTFNIALPDFLRKSVDPEAQRKYLYNTLSSDLQHFLKGLAANAESKYRKIWNDEREKLNGKLREAERLAAEYSQKNNELRQNLLSADRQKRALSTRSAELEKKIYELEADREQRDLESKSMANKVKAVQVYEQEMETMRTEIADLTKQLGDAKKALEQAQAQPSVAVEPLAPLAPEPPKQRPEDAEMIEKLRARLEEASLKIAQLREEKEKEEKRKEEKPVDVKKEEKKKEENKPQHKPEKPRDERIDDILGDTEWIVSPSSSKRKREGERHNTHHDDDRQMSLF